MPGQLKSDAVCPLCEDPLDAIVDETTSSGIVGSSRFVVKRTYYHGKRHPRVRRARPCKQLFVSRVKAQLERDRLEGRNAGDTNPSLSSGSGKVLLQLSRRFRAMPATRISSCWCRGRSGARMLHSLQNARNGLRTSCKPWNWIDESSTTATGMDGFRSSSFTTPTRPLPGSPKHFEAGAPTRDRTRSPALNGRPWPAPPLQPAIAAF